MNGDHIGAGVFGTIVLVLIGATTFPSVAHLITPNQEASWTYARIPNAIKTCPQIKPLLTKAMADDRITFKEAHDLDGFIWDQSSNNVTPAREEARQALGLTNQPQRVCWYTHQFNNEPRGRRSRG